MDWVQICLIGSWILLFISIGIKLKAKDPVSFIIIIMILFISVTGCVISVIGRVFNWW